MKKDINEIRDWLLENRVNEYGDLDLVGLDFSDFCGDVYIDEMKVKGDLYQSLHNVQGDLLQSRHNVQGDLAQGYQEVQGDYFSKGTKVGGDIEFDEPTKQLKKITLDELEEMGYELMEERK